MEEQRLRQRLSSDSDDAERQGQDHTKSLPTSVLLSLLEWLSVSELLAVARVDRSFRDSAKEDSLWKVAARHLWKVALLDGQVLGAEVLGTPPPAGESPCSRQRRRRS